MNTHRVMSNFLGPQTQNQSSVNFQRNIADSFMPGVLGQSQFGYYADESQIDTAHIPLDIFERIKNDTKSSRNRDINKSLSLAMPIVTQQ